MPRSTAAVWLLAIAVCSGCRKPSRDHPRLRFVDVTQAAGLERWSSTFTVAAGDADGDGRIDLFVSRHQSPAVLLHNRGDGTFEETGTFAAGDVHGASWLDWNGDGLLDLFVAVGADWGTGIGPKRLYLNRGGGRLEPAPLPDVVRDDHGRGRVGCPVDVDGDGRIDLLLLNETPGPPDRMLVQSGDGVEDRARPLGLARISGVGAQWVHLDAAGAAAVLTNTFALYRRDGTGRFVAEKLPARLEHAQAVAVGDYDNDGDLDVYVVQGWMEPGGVVVDGALELNLPLRANGRFATRFRARGDLTLDVRHGGPGMSLAPRPELVRLGAARQPISTLPWHGASDDPLLAGSPRPDPRTDGGFFVWREDDGTFVAATVGEPVPGQVRARLTASGGVEVVETLSTNKRPRDLRNRLYENRGGHLVDVTARAGVGHDGLGRDALFADVDNDGDLDLFVVDGGSSAGNPPDVLYRNNGDGTFTDVTAESGTAGPTAGSGNAAVAFDYDGDGDLDLFTVNGFGPPPYDRGPYQLLENRSDTGNFVEVSLTGRRSNRLGFGARVLARTPDGRVLAQERHGCTSTFATSVLPLHFGLGTATSVDLEVTWPSGAVSHVTARSGAHVQVEEPEP